MKKISTLVLAGLFTMAAFAAEQKSSVAAQTNYQNVVNGNDDFRHRGERRDRDDRNWRRDDRDRYFGNGFYRDRDDFRRDRDDFYKNRDDYYKRDFRGDRDNYHRNGYNKNF